MVRTGRHSVKLKWHRKGGGKDKISTLPKVKKKAFKGVRGLSIYKFTCKCEPNY